VPIGIASRAVPTQVDPSIPLQVILPKIKTPLEAAMEAEKLRSLRLQNQQLEEQLRTTLQSTTNDPTPSADFGNASKVAYSCGFLDGMLNALKTSGNADGANAVQEVLKNTTCAQIRTNVGGTRNTSNGPDVTDPYRPSPNLETGSHAL
jgi:hypothetical protein